MLSFNVNVTRVGLEIGCFTSKQLEEQIKQIFKNQLQTSMVNRSIINSTMPYTTVYVNGLTLSNERERDPS
jgi:Ribonuclease G/E